MEIGEFLSKLIGVKISGNGWQAHCTAHEDNKASLSVSTGDDGRILVKCFAGCTVEQIVAAMGLEMKDLFPTRGGEWLYSSENRTTVQLATETVCH